MADIQLSENAKKLLEHFQDKQLRQADFEYPATQQDLFSDPRDCESAQEELERYKLLELGSPRSPREQSEVRAAALTLDGVRYLTDNPL